MLDNVYDFNVYNPPSNT